MTENLPASMFFNPGHIPLSIYYMPYVDWSREVHSHDFHEMMVVTGGVAIHHMDDQHQIISMGDVFVIPPGHLHGYDVPENSGVQVLNVLFDLKRMDTNLRDLENIPEYHALFSTKLSNHFEPHLKLPAKDLSFVHSLVDEISAELEEESPGYEFSCETKFRQLVVFLARRYSNVASLAGKNVLKLGELISYMEQNLEKDLHFAELAKLTHMSSASLRRAFQDTFACSPMAYLQKLRVKRSMILLADPDKSITDVAFETGFRDSGYFSRVFKKETGEGPKEFRSHI